MSIVETDDHNTLLCIFFLSIPKIPSPLHFREEEKRNNKIGKKVNEWPEKKTIKENTIGVSSHAWLYQYSRDRLPANAKI